jgi:hypothetical protein
MRFLTGTSHILVPFPALRLAEARSVRGLFSGNVQGGSLGFLPALERGSATRSGQFETVAWSFDARVS